MSNNLHITFDLETLGTNSTAPIVQIGAVKFTKGGKILDKFLRNIAPDSLQKYDFDVEYRTIYWWLNRDKEVIDTVFGEDNKYTNIQKAMYDFLNWVGEDNKHGTVWSHATFDPPILKNTLKTVGVAMPFHYRAWKDIRTLTRIVGSTGEEIKPRVSMKHNALSDAVYQAGYISQLLQIAEKMREHKSKFIGD